MARPRRPYDEFNPRDLQPFLTRFFRLDRRTQGIVVGLILFAVIVFAIAAYLSHRNQSGPPPTQTPSAQTPDSQNPASSTPSSVSVPISADSSENLLLGNPSNATPDSSNRTNFLLVKSYFTLSYNEDKHTPNWVSWRVTSADLGEAPRKREFDAESALPWAYKRVTHQDYSGSGFDRGHMCPHSDRAANEKMSFATFVLSNIVPQAPNQNQKAWRELEDYSRLLVKDQRQRLYIIAGPNGQGGRGKNGMATTIGRANIVVPAECWKIIVSIPEPGRAIRPDEIPASARVIAVIMPNDNDVITTDVWSIYRVSPAEIEARTGYRFFTNLPTDVADVLRAKVDQIYIPPPKPKKYTGD